jgi:glycerol uptake facilitator-like aquaporin
LAATAALGILDALFPMSNIISKMVVKPPLGETNGGAFFLQFLGATYFIFTYLFFRYDAPNLTITEDMSAVDKKKTKEAQFRFLLRQHLTPFVLGFSYAAATLVGVYLNPWSVLTVCMIAHECGQAWIYCVGGFVGALFGALLFMFLFQFGKPAPKASMNPGLPPIVPEDA